MFFGEIGTATIRCDEALVQYQDALKIRTRLFGDEDLDVANILDGIGRRPG
jgi:hypothetical protein